MTTVNSAVADWPGRAAALADELVAAGKLVSPPWRAAVQAVPRHVFVPAFYLRRDGRMVAVAATDPATSTEWWEQVYTNTALVTKIGEDEPGGPPVFLSSSSTPGLMTRMLESLDVHDGHRVLEIGTGTGYNAALLSHRLGDQQVVSIDVEPDLVAAARTRLAGLGYHPTLVTGDGAAGVAAHAPFDRVIATCSVPAIPWAWVAQTAPGGVLLTDVKVGLAAGNLGPEAVSLATPDGSRAEVTLADDEAAGHRVVETGPTRLWQHVERAHQMWDAAGRPDWPRLGVSVTPTAQTIYVDEPGNHLATLAA